MRAKRHTEADREIEIIISNLRAALLVLVDEELQWYNMGWETLRMSMALQASPRFLAVVMRKVYASRILTPI